MRSEKKGPKLGKASRRSFSLFCCGAFPLSAGARKNLYKKLIYNLLASLSNGIETCFHIYDTFFINVRNSFSLFSFAQQEKVKTSERSWRKFDRTRTSAMSIERQHVRVSYLFCGFLLLCFPSAFCFAQCFSNKNIFRGSHISY